MPRSKTKKQLFRDSHLIPFSEYRKYLPARAADFPPPNRIKDPDLLSAIHASFPICMACRAARCKIEVHHIIGGTKGRSDERTNLITLCHDCHDQVNTAAMPLGFILWLKWCSDGGSIDWVRLAILRRSFLPDLIPDEERHLKLQRERQQREEKRWL